jgi:hypothetical protein
MATKSANTRALLERARLLCDPPTWYQLAQRTGIKHQTLSRCVAHDKTLGDVNAYKLAKILQMDPKDVMAYMAEDRAQDEVTRTFWSHQLPRLLPSIAIAVTATLSAGLTGTLIDGERYGTNAVPFNISTAHAVYYA